MIKMFTFETSIRWLLLWLICLMGQEAMGQSTQILTLEECQLKAFENYPLTKQQGLIEKSTEFSLSNASKAYLPQLSLSGQATYQSDVTSFPVKIPGVNVETLSKDQYKIYGEINQSLTDPIVIGRQKELIMLSSKTEEQRLEVELYKIRERINQLYFGILLLDAQIQQTALLKQDIQTGMDKMKAAIENGIALKSNLDQLKAEFLKVNQRTVELRATRTGYASMLSLFIDQEIDEFTILKKPYSQNILFDIHRPELALYDFQEQGYDLQAYIVKTRTIPKVNLFFQGGYGRPALNFLDNSFKTYYLTGLRFSWNLSSFYTNGKERETLTLNQTMLQVQKETFLFNTSLQLAQQSNEVVKYRDLLQSDKEIIDLRMSIKSTAENQLTYGTITASDYLSYVNAADQARQTELLHEVQWLMAQYQFQTISGNYQ